MADDDVQRRREGLTGILEAFEELVTQARAMPMSSSVIVNRTEALDLVAQAREVLPVELTAADEVLAGADRVLADATARADRLVAEAQERADALVSQERVVAEAHERAAQIVAEAERTAEGLRREADDYCDRRLADFEIDLGRLLAQVQAGRAKLADRLDPPSEPA